MKENGRLLMDGAAEKVKDNPDIKEFYLGLGELGAKKITKKDVKHYKRRKRWL